MSPANDTTTFPPTEADLPSLSIVIPVYNAAQWVEPTTRHVEAALVEAGWTNAELVFIDDGSTDGSAAALAALETSIPFEVVSQSNQGRFLARLHGLEAASGEFAFLIDIRVFIDRDALRFLARQLREHPDRRVWNGHLRTASSWKPWTRFWNPLTFMGWHRYMSKPTTTSFGIDDFDHYPKGTGFFFAPRERLLELCAAFDTSYDDVSMASDDTLLIKPLAITDRINISPDLGGVYFPRVGFAEFVRHSYFRGTTFVDGHVRPGSRFNRPFWAAVVLAGLGLAAFVRWPRPIARAAAGGLVALPFAGRAAGVPLADGASFAVLLPVFGTAYSSGIIRGFVLRRIARRAARSGQVDGAATTADVEGGTSR